MALTRKFINTPYPTPYGYFDSDVSFQRDADSVAIWVYRKLGEDVLSVELTTKEIWACFEEAARMFNAWIIEYQTTSNLSNLLGSPTGSFNSNTGQSTINLTNNYIAPNLEFMNRLAEPYANLIGYGQTQNTFSGSIALETGRQDYDIYTELQDSDGAALYSTVSGSGSVMRVVEVFHYAPIQYLFNSSYGSNFGNIGGVGIPLGAFNSDTRFHALPLFEDVLRASMLETASRVRRSHYTWQISGRNIRIFPTPSTLIPGFNDRLWLRVSFAPQATGGAFIDLGVSGSASSGSVGAAGFSGQFYGVSNPANAPFGLVTYSTLNMWAKNWIFQMTFALAMAIVGRTRRKIKRFPAAASELELDGNELVQEAREDMQKLIDELKAKLESLSYDKLQEMETAKAENLLKQLTTMPMPPTFLIRMFE